MPSVAPRSWGEFGASVDATGVASGATFPPPSDVTDSGAALYAIWGTGGGAGTNAGVASLGEYTGDGFGAGAGVGTAPWDRSIN